MPKPSSAPPPRDAPGVPSSPPPQSSAQSQPRRRAPATLAALRTGVTAFAVLAGLACYFLLAQIGITGVPAAVVGLVFALLVRVAALSLLREWLLAAARRRR